MKVNNWTRENFPFRCLEPAVIGSIERDFKFEESKSQGISNIENESSKYSHLCGEVLIISRLKVLKRELFIGKVRQSSSHLHLLSNHAMHQYGS